MGRPRGSTFCITLLYIAKSTLIKVVCKPVHIQHRYMCKLCKTFPFMAYINIFHHTTCALMVNQRNLEKITSMTSYYVQAGLFMHVNAQIVCIVLRPLLVLNGEMVEMHLGNDY